jgi:hypothetical protein
MSWTLGVSTTSEDDALGSAILTPAVLVVVDMPAESQTINSSENQGSFASKETVINDTMTAGEMARPNAVVHHHDLLLRKFEVKL